MAISSYPRTIVNGTSDTSNHNSGVGLMLWDSATQTYIAATPSTFGGGGGGGLTNIYDSVGSPILCDDPTQGVLKVAIHNSGGGGVAVSTSALQTTLNGLVSTSALQTTLNNLITTLNGSVSTSALQTTLNGLITTLNGLVNTNNSNNSFATNGGILLDSLGIVTLTTSYVALTSNACKYVTLVNLSTNAKLQYNINNNGTNLTLEAGYSVRINCSNTNKIYVAQTTGEGQTLQYIVSA